MKKFFRYIIIAVSLTTACTTANAQNNPPPTPIARATAKGYIMDYQSGHVNEPNSGSFLINASGLKDYLGVTPANGIYLHIYIAAGYSSSNDPFLILARTLRVNGDDSFYHDPNVPNVIATTKTGDHCCVHIDANLDGPQDYYGQLCNGITSTVSINKSLANGFLMNYQIDSNQCIANPPNCVTVFNRTQSFIFNATTLQTYLNDNSIVSLQIYFAKKTLPNTDRLTLVMVGINFLGQHVYYPTNSVFDECNPCPRCRVQHDNDLDYEHQDYVDTEMERAIYNFKLQHPNHNTLNNN